MLKKNEGSKAKILKNIKRTISFRKENHLPHSHQAKGDHQPEGEGSEGFRIGLDETLMPKTDAQNQNRKEACGPLKQGCADQIVQS